MSFIRRRRFRAMINRAKQRRRFLDERRKIAQRLYTNEAQVREMKARLGPVGRPGGALQVKTFEEARATEAAKRVQNCWRTVRSRRMYFQLKREKAAHILQGFVRRRRARMRQLKEPTLMKLAQNAMSALPRWGRAMDDVSILRYEEENINKRKQYNSAMCKGMSQAEMKEHAMSKYIDFVDNLAMYRNDMLRTVMHKEHLKQLEHALEAPKDGLSKWDKEPPYGVCSKVCLQEAERKHKERMKSMGEQLWLGEDDGPEIGATPLVVESWAEEMESDLMLRDLEADLGGYDFSLGKGD